MRQLDNTQQLRQNYLELKSINLDSGTELSGITDFLDSRSLDYFSGDTLSKLSYRLEVNYLCV